MVTKKKNPATVVIDRLLEMTDPSNGYVHADRRCDEGVLLVTDVINLLLLLDEENK